MSKTFKVKPPIKDLVEKVYNIIVNTWFCLIEASYFRSVTETVSWEPRKTHISVNRIYIMTNSFYLPLIRYNTEMSAYMPTHWGIVIMPPTKNFKRLYFKTVIKEFTFVSFKLVLCNIIFVHSIITNHFTLC